MNYQADLEIAQKAAKEAAKIIRKYANDESFSIKLKAKNDLVTDADLASEKKIIEILKEAYPQDQILAEETRDQSSISHERTWIIDPIDGTTNFAHEFPIYCISIALWQDKEPRVALVLEVANGEMFSAIKGKGTFLNGKQVVVSEIDDPASSLIGTGFPYNNLNLIDNYLRLFRDLMDKTHGIRRPGSAAWDMCNVACGRFEGFYEYGLSPWDVAAGSLLITEAGGKVTDWEGNDDWLFGRRIVAGNNRIHEFLLKEIKHHFNADELTGKKS